MRFFLFLLFIPMGIFSIERQPWFGDVYEFQCLAQYAYSYYKHVDAAVVPLQSTSKDHLLSFDLEFPFSSYWTADADVQFSNTPRQSFGFRSGAFQIRHLFLDDIVGDFISLSMGGSVRAISQKSYEDISCPYHGRVDFEGNLAIGKEWDQLECWRFRMWGYGAIGVANKGSPWLNATFAMETNSKEKYKLAVFSNLSHGYGKKTEVDISDFHGYGDMRYKNIDVGFHFGYRLGVWGTVKAGYIKRVLAKKCPENTNTFFISYLLPFSF